MVHRLVPAIVPVLLVAIGYVDPGKWAAAVEGGAHFGSDLIFVMLVFNLAAILCQYLSARIAMVTGRDLSQICSEEYDKATCVLLGVLTEISMIVLDLSMILGIAQGLNIIFGLDLFICVFLTAIDAVLYPVFATFLGNGKVKSLCVLVATFILLFYVLCVLSSQPEIAISTSGMLTKLSGESAFALMSLLGANIMPHNFYLHSSIVQQELGPTNVSKGLLCHDHFWAILCMFSGIFLVNSVLINAAANVFNSTGLVLLTLQDALSLMDQLFRSSVAPVAFLLVLFASNQITALTWSVGRLGVLYDFFGVDIPNWLHHVTIRIVAIIPALCCVWNTGAEGMYQLLIFSQVVVALVLPSSVIPLFRIASSRSIMGAYKISQFLEFSALMVFFGMLGLKIIFVEEIIFGDSDWVVFLKWSVGSSLSTSYVILLITAFTSLCLMLWLAVTPLKSASRLDAQAWNWDMNDGIAEPFLERQEGDFIDATDDKGEHMDKQEPVLVLGKSGGCHSSLPCTDNDQNLPETLLDSENMPLSTMIEDNDADITFPSPSKFHPEETTSRVEAVVVSTISSEGFVGDLVDNSGVKTESSGFVESVDTIALKTETIDVVEKSVEGKGDLTRKEDEEDAWEPEASFKGVSESSPALTSEGPGSYRCLGGKSEDSGSGAGSLSRLAGLGRASRRHLAAVLDEFWGQLFGFHGQATQQAKSKKWDVILGLDLKDDPKPVSPLKVDTHPKECTATFPSMGGRGSASQMISSVYETPKPLGMQRSIDRFYGIQKEPSSSWSSHLEFLNAYVENSSQNDADFGERRYSSLRFPSSFDGNDYQPATVHGYQIKSYLSRVSQEQNFDSLNGQAEALTPKSTSMGALHYRDPLAFVSRRKLQNGLSNMTPPGFSKPVVPRNISLQPERIFNDGCCPGPAKNTSNSVNTKKFHSLPDISGLSLPYRSSYLSDKGAGWESPMAHGPPLCSPTSLKAEVPFSFDNQSSSPNEDPLSLQFGLSSDSGSLWTRQPFEQFGVADKGQSFGCETPGLKQSSITAETSFTEDLEANKLLQSFRDCIVKLLKMEGSDWLFRQNDGADEDLIDRVAARERFLCEAETREMSGVVHMSESQCSFDRKPGSLIKNDDIDHTKILASSVPHCGEGCIWRVDLIISFGIWCIHRVLELSLMESRPELWGKYTYVLNRLQGIIDAAFLKPRTPMTPCFCLKVPATLQHRAIPPISNGSLPPPAKQGKGKCTTAATLLDIIKDVEIAISCRKGRAGTAAGDVAFPKGKENLASVLKRYKRRLSTRKALASTPCGS